jgi:hypothetical protein
MSGFGEALRSIASRHKPSFDRITELREAGLTTAEAIEAVEEEEQLRERQLQEKEAKMGRRGTGVAGIGKPDFSNLKHQPAVGIHDGYTERDLEQADAADGVGTSAKPDEEVIFHNEATSPTLKRWKAEENARVAEREAREREILEIARAELDAEADEEKKRMEVERVKESILAGTLRREPGR